MVVENQNASYFPVRAICWLQDCLFDDKYLSSLPMSVPGDGKGARQIPLILGTEPNQ